MPFAFNVFDLEGLGRGGSWIEMVVVLVLDVLIDEISETGGSTAVTGEGILGTDDISEEIESVSRDLASCCTIGCAGSFGNGVGGELTVVVVVVFLTAEWEAEVTGVTTFVCLEAIEGVETVVCALGTATGMVGDSGCNGVGGGLGASLGFSNRFFSEMEKLFLLRGEDGVADRKSVV